MGMVAAGESYIRKKSIRGTRTPQLCRSDSTCDFGNTRDLQYYSTGRRSKQLQRF